MIDRLPVSAPEGCDKHCEDINQEMTETTDERQKYYFLDPRHGIVPGCSHKLLVSRLGLAGEVVESLSNEFSIYRRPSVLSTKLLPPLPEGMRRIHQGREVDKILSTLPSYRLPAFLLLIGVLSMLVLLLALAPILIISPLLVLFGLLNLLLPGVVAVVVATVIGMYPLWVVLTTLGAILLLIKHRSVEAACLRGALREEQWFRSGAEGWTLSQKIASCVVFGWVHIYGLIYPVATLISACFAGGVIMYVYQREYERSQDVTAATLAATKLHARYNVYAIRTFAIAMVVLAYIPLL